MIKKITFILAFVSFVSQAQIQINTPWTLKDKADGKSVSNLTLEEISKSAEAFFAIIDRNKKGSGLKPFERWKYHWSFYTDEKGVIKPAKDLWDAWEKKNNRKSSITGRTTADVSNWQSLGPSSHTNTASWSSGQGRVNTVAIDPNNPNIYYVGAPAGGIWKSIDAGSTWAPLVDHLPQIGVSGIAIDPSDSDTIYITTGDDDAADSYSVGVWKSTDGGATWNSTAAINPLASNYSMNEIYIFPNNTQTLLVATSIGVYKTTNGGTNWSQVRSGNIIDLKMKPGDSTTWYCASPTTVYRSTDSGQSFSAVSIPTLTGSGRLVLDVTPANANYVYVLSSKNSSTREFNGLYRSTNSGVSFTKMAETDNILESTQAWFDLALGVSDTDENTVFVGCLNIWKSTSGGDNFTKVNYWNAPTDAKYTHGDIHFLRYSQGKLLAGTDGGFYQSTNDGASFTDLTNNMAISQFYKISVSAQNSGNVVGGLQDNGGYAFSNNRWNVYHGADGMDNAIDRSSPNTYHGFIQYGGGLYTSTDGGLTRNNGIAAPSAETGTGDSGGEWVTPLISDSKGKLYAGYSKLYKLESTGWVQTSSFGFSGDLDHLEIDPNNDSNIFLAQGSQLYRTNDAGLTFSSIVFNNGTINGMEVSPFDSNTMWVVTNGNVFVSNNINSASPTFQTVGTNIPSEGKFTLKFHKRSGTNALYLGTALGVYYINDNETEWQTFDNNLPNVAVRDLEINELDSKIYAATFGRGVFISDLPRVLQSNDVKLESIVNLDGVINCGDVVAPMLTVKNEGINTITSLAIDYSLNGVAQSTYNWTGSIASLETTSISLPDETLDIGNFDLAVTVNLTGDSYLDNNAISASFKVNDPTSNPISINDFEDTNQSLLQEVTGVSIGDTWKIGKPEGTLLNTASSGEFVYGTSLRGNYSNNTVSYLYSNCYDLSVIENPKIKFKMGFDIENEWDYLTFEYSLDSGKTWSILGDATAPNWFTSSAVTNSSNQSTLPGKQWTGLGESSNPAGGTNAELHEYSYDLAALTSETNIIFRFNFYADEAQSEEGVIIDDFGIEGTVLSVSNNELQDNFLVYPNPSSGIFNLSWASTGKAEVIVYNYLGKAVLTNKNIEENTHSLDLSLMSKGLYFIKVNVDGKQAVRKVILE
ncbi:T9SS type A sorting domain-containing protein [Polaribacter sp. MSW13]|uniref:T9SS type A sorting domain-containing protein n=1 Tax=Polaribacter marinus TaxID=2916838 RepID=A0A9X1VMJ2_9FLAO|nr:T9SS type A sorting domain-containing protein [Polaribacter marinus]MCI2229264.1 T9SS type A sorting domain-containing protein [Polaribacter marinus]